MQHSRVKVIKDFFELSSKEAMTEVKALSDAEKTELAVGAAQNMGLTQEQVAFPLE